MTGLFIIALVIFMTMFCGKHGADESDTVAVRNKREATWSGYHCGSSATIFLNQITSSPSAAACDTSCFAQRSCISFEYYNTGFSKICYMYSGDCSVYAGKTTTVKSLYGKTYAVCPDIANGSNALSNLSPPYRQADVVVMTCYNGSTTSDGASTVATYTCLQNGSWDRPVKQCRPKINYCATNPCLNGGTCVVTNTTASITCICVGQWTGTHCERYGFPKDTKGIVAVATQTIGCITVITLLSITICGYLVAQDFSPQPFTILLADITALIAHILILTCRSPFIADLTILQCKIVAMTIQISLLSSWSFLLFQIWQSFAITIAMITSGNWPLSKKYQIIAVSLGLPTAIIAVSFWTNYNDFVNERTCLINYGSHSNRVFLVTAAIIGSLICIFAESSGTITRNEQGEGINGTGKDMKKAKGRRVAGLLLAVDRGQYISGVLGLRSSLIVFMMSFYSFLLGSLAVYNIDNYLFPAAFISHISTGIAVFILHCVQHPLVWAILTNFFYRLCPCCCRRHRRRAAHLHVCDSDIEAPRLAIVETQMPETETESRLNRKSAKNLRRKAKKLVVATTQIETTIEIAPTGRKSGRQARRRAITSAPPIIQDRHVEIGCKTEIQYVKELWEEARVKPPVPPKRKSPSQPIPYPGAGKNVPLYPDIPGYVPKF